MPKVQYPSNLASTENQIKALEAILPYETLKDREIHKRALNDLRKHRAELIKKLKHGRKLSLREKKLLTKEGYDPNKYLRIKRTSEYLEFINIETKKTLPVRW